MSENFSGERKGRMKIEITEEKKFKPDYFSVLIAFWFGLMATISHQYWGSLLALLWLFHLFLAETTRQLLNSYASLVDLLEASKTKKENSHE